MDRANQSLDGSRFLVLHADGKRKPLFVFPGLGGEFDQFVNLSSLIDADRPIYGIRLLGSQGECEPIRDLQRVARIHAAEIRSVQAHGPYFLFGYSFGGVLAFEVARELTCHGERVGLVAMVDCPAPGYPKLQPALVRARVHARNFIALSGVERLNYLRARIEHRFEPALRLLRLVRGSDARPQAEADHADVNTLSYGPQRRVANAFEEAYSQYVPAPLAVDVLFLTADTPPDWPATDFDDPLMGWGSALRSRIIQCQTPGTHWTIFDSDNAAVMARHLRLGLRQAERLGRIHAEASRSDDALA
jgi:thioesterase domain-containing protein